MLREPMPVVENPDQAFPPPGWDVDRDLFLIVGHGGHAIASMVHEAGQKRLIVYQPVDCPPVGYPPSAAIVSSLPAMHGVMRTYSDPPPRTIFVRPFGDLMPEFHQVAQEARDHLDTLCMNDQTVRYQLPRWTRNGLVNLPQMAEWPTVSCLDASFRGKPLVIVCPGPSLSKNIALLERVKGKAIILAINHSLGPLLRAEAPPVDFIMVDEAEPCGYHFDGYPVDEVAAVLPAATCWPKVWTLPAHAFFSFTSNTEWDSWIRHLVDPAMDLPGAVSVATHALVLGMRWACNPIIFIGNDLALTGGQCYAEGVPESGDVQRTEIIEAWGGGFVPTTDRYGFQARWMQGILSMFCKDCPQARIINATEGGARVPAMTEITFERAIAKYLRDWVDISGPVNRSVEGFRRQRVSDSIRKRIVEWAKARQFPDTWTVNVAQESAPLLDELELLAL